MLAHAHHRLVAAAPARVLRDPVLGRGFAWLDIERVTDDILALRGLLRRH